MGMNRLGTVISRLNSSRTLPPSGTPSGSTVSRLIGPRRSLRVPRKEWEPPAKETLGDRHVAKTEAVLNGKGKMCLHAEKDSAAGNSRRVLGMYNPFEKRQSQLHFRGEKMSRCGIERVITVSSSTKESERAVVSKGLFIGRRRTLEFSDRSVWCGTTWLEPRKYSLSENFLTKVTLSPQRLNW